MNAGTILLAIKMSAQALWRVTMCRPSAFDRRMRRIYEAVMLTDIRWEAVERVEVIGVEAARQRFGEKVTTPVVAFGSAKTEASWCGRMDPRLSGTLSMAKHRLGLEEVKVLDVLSDVGPRQTRVMWVRKARDHAC